LTDTESQRIEKSVPSKWNMKASRSSCFHSSAKRPQVKIGRHKDHYILMRTIHQGDQKIVNIYVPNIGAFNFIKQALLNIKTQIGSDTK
jgi:hypothetical protein